MGAHELYMLTSIGMVYSLLGSTRASGGVEGVSRGSSLGGVCRVDSRREAAPVQVEQERGLGRGGKHSHVAKGNISRN
jgi:hypothetical protein